MNSNFLKSINFRNGIITYNDFNIDPLIPFLEQKYSLKNNMLLVDYHNYMIDVGWYPEFIVGGKFIIKAIHNCDWKNPLCEIESKNFVELKVNLQMMINHCEKLTSHTNLIDINTKYSPV